jgi:3-carboxy-cis,cis-muconate cycloisomerase
MNVTFAHQSGLLSVLFDPAAMRARFDDLSRVQTMLDFEAALAAAEAELGVIPQAAVVPITAACDARLYSLDALANATARAGNPAIPLVAALTQKVAEQDPDAARYVHWGATSQDVIDTALVLQVRAALTMFDAQLARLADALLVLIREHRGTVMAGRTFLQHAVPTTLGLKAAGWWSAVDRDRQRLSATGERVVCLQFGGAAGTLGALGNDGIAVSEGLARALALSLPELPWHAQRDRVAELGCALGVTVGSLGKLARDVSLLMQTEVGEAREPTAPGQGGSSTMPHKQNPVGCTVALAAAVRAPGLVSTLLASMVQEHERGLGGWHAEWETLPTLFCLASGAAEALAVVVEGLEVDRARMRNNLAQSGGAIYAENVSMALAKIVGKSAAHALFAEQTLRARETGEPLDALLRNDAALRAQLGASRLEQLLSPEHALGAADPFIERVLARADRKQR